jgi:Tol biopolymer transport system component
VRYTLAIDSAEALSTAIPWAGRIAISPDGKRFAYVSDRGHQLLIRKWNELHATPIQGTEDASTPFFSPDGRSVAFLREQSIQIATVDGGPLITIPDSLSGVAGASWGLDGFIYTDGLRATPLARIKARQGAVPEWFTTLDTVGGEIDHLWPEVLPNGKGVLFTVLFSKKLKAPERSASAIAVADIASGKHHVILDDAAYPRYTSSGELLYVTPKGTLMMVTFDQNAMKVTGEPARLLEGIRVGAFGAADLTVSKAGTLVYSLGTEQFNEELLWRARDGKSLPVDADWHGAFVDPSISADGKTLAISRSEDGRTADVWIKQLDRGPAIRLTEDGIYNRGATWTPDGRSVTFVGNSSSGTVSLSTRSADGSGGIVTQRRDKRAIFAPRWSPDSAWLIYTTDYARIEGADIVGIRPGVDTTQIPLIATRFQDTEPALSPDGHWLAYVSNESGRDEIYIVPFPNTRTARFAISSNGGGTPIWAHSENELFYRDQVGDIFAVAIRSRPKLSSGKPRRLFAAPYNQFPYGTFGISPDDRRFLMVHQLSAATPDKLIVVENWFEELKSKAN